MRLENSLFYGNFGFEIRFLQCHSVQGKDTFKINSGNILSGTSLSDIKKENGLNEIPESDIGHVQM